MSTLKDRMKQLLSSPWTRRVGTLLVLSWMVNQELQLRQLRAFSVAHAQVTGTVVQYVQFHIPMIESAITDIEERSHKEGSL